MNERIAAAGLVMGFGLGFMQLACGTEGTGATGSTPPPLTEEERAVTEKTAEGTLAEITLPDEKVRFVEYEPGRVLVMHQARIGGPLTRVPSEDKMTLPQIFHAYAPDQEVPSALTQAMARVAAANDADAQQVAGASAEAEKATTPAIGPARPAVETHGDDWRWSPRHWPAALTEAGSRTTFPSSSGAPTGPGATQAPARATTPPGRPIGPAPSFAATPGRPG